MGVRPGVSGNATPGGSVKAFDGARTLVDPTGTDLLLLHYAVSGSEPPFREIAQHDPSVQAANEFDREALITKVSEQLKATARTVRDVRALQVSIEGYFGQYDEKYREFDFDLSDGTVISKLAFGREVDLVLSNGGLAQSWPMEPSEAADVLRRTGGNRQVVLVLKLEILDAPPAIEGAPLRINTRIAEYEIRSKQNLRLGRVVVRK